MIKELLKSVREYKKYAIATPIIVAIDVIIEIIIPLLVAKLIDNGINEGNVNYIWKIGIILVATALTALGLGVLHGKTAAKASTGFAKNLRKDMYYRIQNFSFENIDKFSTSSLVTRLTTDVTNVQTSFQMMTRIAVRAPLMIIFALIMVIGINSKLTLVFLAIIPILVIGLALIIIKAFPLFEKVFKTYDSLNNVVQENVRGIRVVKSYVLEDEENEKFNKVSNTIYKLFSKAEKIVALNSPLMQFAMYGGILLLAWFSTKFIIAGDMTTGELTSVISYSTQILINLMMLSMTFVMIIMSKASAERIVEVLNEKSNIHNPENPIYKVKNGDVEFKNVNFSYVNDENKACLQNVTLDIKTGETVGIIGGTGSSKTTLVQLIPRLYEATTGEVLVGGINVKQYDIETLRNEVSMVLQKNVLFSGTIKENLRWGNKEATDEEIERVCKLAQAHEFINQFPNKYDTYIEQGGTNISGGQKQRLCIARALLKKPKILILDDSTSAVDTKTDSLIRKAFREEIPNTTKFIIAQRVSSIEEADKIIVMDNGKINAVGKHDELLKENEIYKEVYYSQNKGGMTDEK